MKFFADQCVPKKITDMLTEAGHEVLILKNYIPKESPDHIVIAKAQELNAVLISLNGDFADIITYPPQNYKGIISLRIKNRIEIIPQIIERLTNYLQAFPDMKHYKGKLFQVEAHRIRTRK